MRRGFAFMARRWFAGKEVVCKAILLAFAARRPRRGGSGDPLSGFSHDQFGIEGEVLGIGSSGALMRRTRSCAAAQPILYKGWRTVVRRGLRYSAMMTSSKPMTEISRGHESPAS